jgi:hypothetical protein
LGRLLREVGSPMKRIARLGPGCLLVCGMLLMDHGRVLAQEPQPASTLPFSEAPPVFNPLLADVPFIAEPTTIQGPPPLNPAPADEPPVPEPTPVPPVRSRPSPFPTSLGSGIGGGVGMSSYGGFAPGQLGGSGAFGGPGFMAPRISYAAAWYPNQPVAGQNTGLGNGTARFVVRDAGLA